MVGFLERMLGRGGPKGSSSTAKERLQFVLVHDRLNLAPDRLDEMKQEILAVISKYLSVDNNTIDIAFEKRERSSLMVAEVPFSNTHNKRERDTNADEESIDQDDA